MVSHNQLDERAAQGEAAAMPGTDGGVRIRTWRWMPVGVILALVLVIGPEAAGQTVDPRGFSGVVIMMNTGQSFTTAAASRAGDPLRPATRSSAARTATVVRVARLR